MKLDYLETDVSNLLIYGNYFTFSNLCLCSFSNEESKITSYDIPSLKYATKTSSEN